MLKFGCRLHSTSNSNVELPMFNFRTYSDPCALFTFRSTSPFRSMFRFRACIALIRVWCVFNPVHCLYMHFDLACEQCGALDTHHLYICFAHFNSTSRCRLAFIFSFCCMRCMYFMICWRVFTIHIHCPFCIQIHIRAVGFTCHPCAFR